MYLWSIVYTSSALKTTPSSSGWSRHAPTQFESQQNCEGFVIPDEFEPRYICEVFEEFESHDICEVFKTPEFEVHEYTRFSRSRNSSPTIFARFSRNSSPTRFVRFSRPRNSSPAILVRVSRKSSPTIFAKVSRPRNSSPTKFTMVSTSRNSSLAFFRRPGIRIPRYLRWFRHPGIRVPRYLRGFRSPGIRVLRNLRWFRGIRVLRYLRLAITKGRVSSHGSSERPLRTTIKVDFPATEVPGSGRPRRITFALEKSIF